MKQHRILILGTGTNVGKTHASLALLAAAAGVGLTAAGLKPIETGVRDWSISDAAQLCAASTFHVKHPPYAFAPPVSPHRAARDAGIVIDLHRIAEWIDEHPSPLILIESAGGAVSPLGLRRTNLDLALVARPTSVLLVAPDRLGVLHDVSATLLACRNLAPALPRPLALLQSPADPDASTGLNAEDLHSLGISLNVHVFPRGSPGCAAVQSVATALLRELIAGA